MTGLEDVVIALCVDIVFVVATTGMVARYGRLSHSHPMTIYLFFHVLTFTTRLFSLSMGAATLFSDLPAENFDMVTYEEICRAAMLADLALMVMGFGCVLASLNDHSRQVAREETVQGRAETALMLDEWCIKRVVAVTLPLGGFALLYVSGRGADEVMFGQSSYIQLMPSWAGVSLLALIYYYGFTRKLMTIMLIYILFMALQGYHRYRAIIPCVFMMQLYLDQTGRKWPTLRMCALIVMLALVFFPLKQIGRSVKEGRPITEIIEQSMDSIGDAASGEHGDAQFMDQFAMGLTLVDQSGAWEYGYGYVPALTLWIPRQLWAGKPGIGYWMHRIATPWRPIGEMGMIVTILGESYVNFGLFGIFMVIFLVGYILSRFYFVAYRLPQRSVVRFTYLMVSCNLIQGYRDGVTSILIYPTAHMIPLTLIVILHVFDSKPQYVHQIPGYDVNEAMRPRPF